MLHLLTNSGGANPRCLRVPEGSQLSEDQAIERIATWLTSERSHRIVAEVLLAFAYTFVQASLMGWRGKDDPTYLHCLIAREPVTGSSYITMLPKSWPTHNVAIPVVLADDDFEILQRLWILTKRDDIQDRFDCHYRLLGKQVIVGPPIKKTFVRVEAFRIHGPLQCDDVEVVRHGTETSRMGDLGERVKRDYERLFGEFEARPPVLDWRMFGNVIPVDEHDVV